MRRSYYLFLRCTSDGTPATIHTSQIKFSGFTITGTISHTSIRTP